MEGDQNGNGCAKPEGCGEDCQKDVKWEIPASVLQVIWGDLLPRFTAYQWAGLTPLLPLPTGAVNLKDVILAYVLGTPWALGTANPKPFERRLQFVLDYLDPATNAKPPDIPITVLGEGGFDFILSDAGLDLFTVPEPGDDAELLRYFQFRDSGRSAIGLPSYLDGAKALAFDVQSPVGPSQIFTNNTGYTIPLGGSQESCSMKDLEDCLQSEVLTDEEVGINKIRHAALVEVAAAAARAAAKAEVECAKLSEDAEGRADAEEQSAELSEAAAGATRAAERYKQWWLQPIRKFTTSNFITAAAKVRCWQLEGSVYRGILEQLPRVVATVWREEATGTTGVNNSYHGRFHKAKDMRTIFEERLESTLPDHTRMVFRTDTTAAGNPLPDVMISNQGLRFPKADDRPGFVAMLTSIAKGTAGNPVFTDSRRPHQDF